MCVSEMYKIYMDFSTASLIILSQCPPLLSVCMGEGVQNDGHMYIRSYSKTIQSRYLGLSWKVTRLKGCVCGVERGGADTHIFEKSFYG